MFFFKYDWAAMLTPAPISVCLLGQLILVSLDRDCSLVTDEMGVSQFNITRNPQSLRASIMQVANEAWQRFNCTSKNMDAIRLLSQQLPNYIEDIVKVWFIFANDHYEAKLCILWILSGFRNKDAPFVLLLFFHFLWSFRQIFNRFEDLSLQSRNMQTQNCAPIQCTIWPPND